MPFLSRGAVYGAHLRSTSIVGLQVVVVAAALWLIGQIVGSLWVAVLPVILAVVVSTVLWPLVRWLLDKGVSPSVAALTAVLGGVAIFAGVIAAITPSVLEQSDDLAKKASDGITKVEDWLAGPPLNISDNQLNSVVDSITERLQSNGEKIAAGVFTGVSAAGSAVVTTFTVVVLVFFFLKDGRRFTPWLQRTAGFPAADHLAEVLNRVWTTLGGFIRTQAIVSLVDAVLIGIGLVILDVPLAYALAVVTFIGGFVPIVGAFVAGALAVLVALVANGPVTALIVLAIIVAVQQLEGNVLQPWLQAKSMNLHPVLVLLAVMIGGSLFGIVGAFLAVPAAASLAVIARYYGEFVDGKTGGKPQAPDGADPPGEGDPAQDSGPSDAEPVAG
ncbi:AI-2E family transporter [Williamsia sp. CHRR-6]|uniref:AI-2E family transporter n=1 Tax=Williamsia sp. CHRR-6 TaxID=2835871 RepID=UPI00202483E1|nr:AI-2E family transporter [Williamsia sp. CHRR-6]